jgi:hypothetical protein
MNLIEFELSPIEIKIKRMRGFIGRSFAVAVLLARLLFFISIAAFAIKYSIFKAISIYAISYIGRLLYTKSFARLPNQFVTIVGLSSIPFTLITYSFCILRILKMA